MNVLPGHYRDICWVEPLCAPALVTHEASADQRYSAITITCSHAALLKQRKNPSSRLHKTRDATISITYVTDVASRCT